MAVIEAPPVTVANVVAWALMAVAVAAVALSCVGTLVMRSVPDKLHYTAPASLVAPVALAVAALLQDGLDLGTLKLCVAAALLAYAAPLVTHATARAARIRDHGRWELRPEESDPPPR